ncbi:kinase-like domain-containing protein [Cladochytrium replicatum]|nr:kinase-like domain-containing protein [Cladochytrium replicatum]
MSAATSHGGTAHKRRNAPKMTVSVNNMSPSAGGLDSPGAVEAGDPLVGALAQPMQELALPQEMKQDLKQEDLEVLGELGAGNGGTVNRVRNKLTGQILARKVIHVEAKQSVRKQILRELQIMHKCNSPYIVSFYGAFLNEGDISICMEFMPCGSLDYIYKKVGPIPEDVLGQITYAVLAGLVYLYDAHRIIHRDVKPSNILMDSEGNVKIADFGVSGQLINTFANTFVGTSAYMSPERIQGGKYTVQSDVWSVGMSIMELATGKFPFPQQQLSVFELLEFIVNEPVPTLPAGKFSSDLEQLLATCLIKDTTQEKDKPPRPVRPTPTELLHSDPFVKKAEEQKGKVDMKAFAEIVLSKKKSSS